MRLLGGKSAIITGCTRGIGKSVLIAFAQNGADIWACCRTKSDEFEEFAKDLRSTYQVRITPVYFDLTDSSSSREAVRSIMAAGTVIDVLVNNAGVTYNALFQMTSMTSVREMFEINFFAPFILSQYVARTMVRQRSGSIINISSTAALDANAGRSAYGASKAAVICMSRAMAHELAEHNVRVNAIAPGITDTDMVESSMDQRTIQETIQATRLKRIGKPSEVATAVLFLASDLASYVTGEVIRVDGGLQN